MAWTTPTTVSTGDVLTASRYNADVQANLTELAPFFTTWSTWTTTVTQSGTVTHTADYARYLKVGRLVVAQCYLTMTGSGTGNNAIALSLPVATSSSVSNNANIGVGRVIDQSVADYSATIIKVSTTSVHFKITGTTSSGGLSIGANPNFGLVSTDVITALIVYEAAS